MSEYLSHGNEHFAAQVVGSGPGGLGVAIGADHEGIREQLLDEGVFFIDSGKEMGRGMLSGYLIDSNSAWEDFYAAIRPEGVYSPAVDEAKRVEVNPYSMVPLASVGGLLHNLGQITQMDLELAGNSGFMPHLPVEGVVLGSDGSFTSVDSLWRPIGLSESIVFATGSGEERHPINDQYKEKTFLSQEVLMGNEAAIDPIREAAKRGYLVVEGGSHSAYSVGNRLIEVLPDLEKGQIVIMQKRPSALFYSSRDEARVAKYPFDEAQDVCPDTERVYRYGGLRGKAKELAIAMAEGREQRAVRELSSLEEARPLLEGAAGIVQALGTTVREVPIFDAYGHKIGPLRVNGRVDVTADSRLRSFDGKVIPGAYGIGLGYGVLPNPQIGGEPSAKNHPVDSVNMYHGPIGRNIARQIVRRR